MSADAIRNSQAVMRLDNIRFDTKVRELETRIQTMGQGPQTALKSYDLTQQIIGVRGLQLQRLKDANARVAHMLAQAKQATDQAKQADAAREKAAGAAQLAADYAQASAAHDDRVAYHAAKRAKAGAEYSKVVQGLAAMRGRSPKAPPRQLRPPPDAASIARAEQLVRDRAPKPRLARDASPAPRTSVGPN